MAQSEAYEVNAEEWPKYRGFRQLRSDLKEIRLLRLEAGTSSKCLRYVLHPSKLSDSPKYHAVSYCWGLSTLAGSLKEIFINGESVWIRRTLYSFLKTARLHDPAAHLWIDAICIDQSNVGERNLQISIMGEIFESAQGVYIWLGRGDEDTDYAMEHIEDSEPQTHFNLRRFSRCIEKLLRASYWTRRWVIQEFALAQVLTIMWGPRLTSWRNLVNKIDEVLESDPSARRTLANFKRVRLLGSEERMSLLELMEQFQDADCIDRCDRAFALRSIAEDGHRLSPHYDESVADLYLRVLSMLPTERVLPQVMGYRWPHEAASRLAKLLPMTKHEVLKSLETRKDDRLRTVFEYTGVISRVGKLEESQRLHLAMKYSFPVEVRLQGSKDILLYGFIGLKPEDLVYSLQTTPQSPQGLYIAFRPSGPDKNIVGMLISEPDTKALTYWVNVGIPEKNMELIRNIIVHGVSKCSRNNSAVSSHSRALCHIYRITLILLWLLDTRQIDCLWDNTDKLQLNSVQMYPLCNCSGTDGDLGSSSLKGPQHKNVHLEILPSFDFSGESRFWVEEDILPWGDIGEQLSRTQRKLAEKPEITVVPCPQGSPEEKPWCCPCSVDFNYRGREVLPYVAESGQLLFADYFLSKRKVQINSQDVNARTPLWWAIYNGHEKMAQLLIQKGTKVNTPERKYGSRHSDEDRVVEMVSKILTEKVESTNELANEACCDTLLFASRLGVEKVVQLLLRKGADVNAQGGKHGNVLQAASWFGSEVPAGPPPLPTRTSLDLEELLPDCACTSACREYSFLMPRTLLTLVGSPPLLARTSLDLKAQSPDYSCMSAYHDSRFLVPPRTLLVLVDLLPLLARTSLDLVASLSTPLRPLM
jgi:hypothetical protein